MKVLVKINDHSKEELTVKELPIAKAVIESLKDDSGRPDMMPYLKIAARALMGSNIADDDDFMHVSAHICKNSLVNNRYTPDSGHIDVCLIASVYDLLHNQFVKFCCNLSDALAIDGTDEALDNLKARTYYVFYREVDKNA